MGKGKTKQKKQANAMKISPEDLKAQEQRFFEKFGRRPGPDDPIFFDPDASTPQPIDERKLLSQMVELAARVGVDAALLYATNKTGRMITKENRRFLTPEEQQEWDDAITEYRRLEKENDTPQ